MMAKTGVLTVVACACLLGGVSARAQQTGDGDAAATAIPQNELSADVPALADLHEVVFPLWHEAYPARDCARIRELLPQADELVAGLGSAVLPGILRDKQAAWDAGMVRLKDALAALHRAAGANDEGAMLEQTEAFHAAFEGLVRTIRPVVPALDAFHQELYKLYHYYAPAYDFAAIRAQALAMKERIPPLAESKLPARVADRQEKFAAAVAALSAAVDDMIRVTGKDDHDAVLASVERVHTAYVMTERIFD